MSAHPERSDQTEPTADTPTEHFDQPEEDTTDSTEDTGEPREPVAPVISKPVSYVAETCAVAGLLLIAAVLVGAQPLHLLGQLTAEGPNTQLAHTLLADGAQALVAVLFGIGALFCLRPGSGQWVRWVAGGTIIVGILYVLIAAVGYPMVPPDQPQPEQMPMPQ